MQAEKRVQYGTTKDFYFTDAFILLQLLFFRRGVGVLKNRIKNCKKQREKKQ